MRGAAAQERVGSGVRLGSGRAVRVDVRAPPLPTLFPGEYDFSYIDSDLLKEWRIVPYHENGQPKYPPDVVDEMEAIRTKALEANHKVAALFRLPLLSSLCHLPCPLTPPPPLRSGPAPSAASSSLSPPHNLRPPA